MSTVESITSRRRAAALLTHPIRTQILAIAQIPVSASDLARTLGLPRQRVNYHVQQLASVGFLKPAAELRKRNMVEKQYVASSAAYILSPEVLGEVALEPAEITDSASPRHMIAFCARAQVEVAAVMAAASAAGLRARTFAMQRDVRFESVAQRADFTEALTEAFNEIVARHSSPYMKAAGGPAPGRPFRVLLGCYPVPAEKDISGAVA